MKSKDRVLFLLAFFTFFAVSFGANLVVNITAFLPFGKYSWVIVSSIETVMLASVWWWGKSYQIKATSKIDQAPFIIAPESNQSEPVVIRLPSIVPNQFSGELAWLKKEEIEVVSDYLRSIENFMKEKIETQNLKTNWSSSSDLDVSKDLDTSLEKISLMADEIFKSKMLALNASLESNFKTLNADPYKKLAEALGESTQLLVNYLAEVQASMMDLKSKLEKIDTHERVPPLSDAKFIKSKLEKLENWTKVEDGVYPEFKTERSFSINRHKVILSNMNSLLKFLDSRLESKIKNGAASSIPLKNVS